MTNVLGFLSFFLFLFPIFVKFLQQNVHAAFKEMFVPGSFYCNFLIEEAQSAGLNLHFPAGSTLEGYHPIW